LSNTEIKLYRYFFAGTGTLGTIVQLNNGKNKIRIGAKGVDPMYFTKKEIKNKSSIQFYTTDYRFKSFIAAIKQYQPGLVDSVKSDLLIKLEKRSAHKLFIILMFIVILASGQFFAFFIRDFLGLSDNRTGLFVVIYYILAIVVIILVVNLKKPKEYQIAKEGDWLKLINNKGVIASGNISSLKFVLYNQYGKFGVFNSAHTGVSIKILFPRKTIHVLTLDPLVIWKDNFKNKHFLPNYSITKMNLLKLVNALGIKENLLKI
jgi:hypothetical protein